jgi:hypothetical protein
VPGDRRLLRRRDCRALHEGRAGIMGRRKQSLPEGIAKETDDPDVVAATISAPGVVLRRPVGSNGPFKEDADLPTNIEGGHGTKKLGRRSADRAPAKPPKSAPGDPAAERKAALAYEREEKRRQREREREEAAR